MIGPPWVTTPAAWSIDDRRFRLHEPPVTDLAAALQAELGGVDGPPTPLMGAIHVIVVLTHPVSRPRFLMWLLDEDRPHMSGQQMQWIADDLTHAVTGWRRWMLQRVWAEALGAWAIVDGQLLGRGVDVTRLPFGRATNAVYACLSEMHSGDADHYRRWWDSLDRPPPRQVRREILEASAAEVESEFAAMEAMLSEFDTNGSDPGGTS